jgi:(R)-2-hydroxyacyl-CoA dehydratese activating ATPase
MRLYRPALSEGIPPQGQAEHVYVGCDLGIATVKVALLSSDRVLAWNVLPYTNLPKQAAVDLLDQVLADGGVTRARVSRCLATGLGKGVVPFADEVAPARQCLLRAVRELTPRVGTVLDVGGHSFEAFSLGPHGDIAESTIDDKCATGTGLYIELMARALDTALDDLIRGALSSASAVPMTSQCAILAESEVISLLSDGHEKYSVFAGVARAVATKIAGLVSQVGMVGEILLAGGVAKNAVVVKEFEAALQVRLADPVLDPQVLGAVGAALLARDRALGLLADCEQSPFAVEKRLG